MKFGSDYHYYVNFNLKECDVHGKKNSVNQRGLIQGDLFLLIQVSPEHFRKCTSRFSSCIYVYSTTSQQSILVSIENCHSSFYNAGQYKL